MTNISSAPLDPAHLPGYLNEFGGGDQVAVAHRVVGDGELEADGGQRFGYRFSLAGASGGCWAPTRDTGS